MTHRMALGAGYASAWLGLAAAGYLLTHGVAILLTGEPAPCGAGGSNSITAPAFPYWLPIVAAVAFATFFTTGYWALGGAAGSERRWRLGRAAVITILAVLISASYAVRLFCPY